ncbi:dynein light chain Tctex-type 5-B-like [Haliotis asinina]|uniref:dynein light chain Tctex-type 5-B-like n=1 Tax=Haliotis asinina TaxID=109174 RepID=UPI003531E334
MMSDREIARDKAARLLKKQGSVSSLASSEATRQHGPYKVGSMSTVSFLDEPGHDETYRIPVKFENTYQLSPNKRFPYTKVQNIIKDVLEAYLAEERYEPELCRQMSKTLSEVIKARVKELMIPRYKIICLVHIGQLGGQDMRVSSRCLWDAGSDTFSTSEFRNQHLYAIGSVYGVYYE